MKTTAAIRKQIYVYLFISLSFLANATHNRAGEITYQWLYGYTYKIKITTYTNTGGTNLADRCYDTLYFGDGARFVVPRTNGTTTSLCGGGSGVPFDGVVITPTIKKNEYETTHTYPGPGSYKMSMEDPNRNAGVINIPNSVNQTFYIESYLVINAVFVNNNSPVLTFPPIDQGCVNQCFYHNPGAYDTDGDSLSYDTTYCRGIQGSGCPGYTYPSGTIYTIDPLTGTLTWCSPAIQGEYNMAMIIKEWRKDGSGIYQMIGYIIRDMQVDIGSCNNMPPTITLTTADHYVLAGTNLTTGVSATDNDGNTIALSANGGPFNIGANTALFNSVPASSTATGTFNWNTNYANVRRMPYQVTLKVKDNGAGVNLVNPVSTLHTMFTQLATPLQSYTVNATGYNSFTCANGTRIITMPNSFLTKSGAPVSGNVTIEVKDVLSKKDMVLNNAFPVSNGQLLVSGGEVYFNPTQNGQQLKLNPAVRVTFLVPAGNTPSYQMQEFYAQGPSVLSDSTSILNWVQATNTGTTTGIQVGQDTAFGGSINYYDFDSDSVNWTNCDYFANTSGAKTTCTVNLSGNANNSNTMVFLSKNGVVSIARLSPFNIFTVSQQFKSYVNSIPLGANYTVGAISFDGSNYYYASQQITMTTDMVITMPVLTQTTKNQIEINLAGLP
jgi:hypothetical protein